MKKSTLNRVSSVVYATTGLLTSFYFYQHQNYVIYTSCIILSFTLLNALVLHLYQRFKQKSMALMKFMGINFSKDILWAILWMYVIGDNSILAVYVAGVFFLLSVPLYISVLKTIENDQKSDKNQS